jgi:hypothetical protein
MFIARFNNHRVKFMMLIVEPSGKHHKPDTMIVEPSGKHHKPNTMIVEPSGKHHKPNR